VRLLLLDASAAVSRLHSTTWLSSLAFCPAGFYLFVGGLHQIQFQIAQPLDIDQLISRRLHGPNQFVQLEVNRGFFAVFSNNREFSPAHPKIKQTVGTFSLRREDLFRLDANNCSSRARSREVCIRIEAVSRVFGHTQTLHRERRWSVLSSSVVT
jgi:hypothetical protein